MFTKYLDQGYFTLPCKKASKASALQSGYSTVEYCENGVSEDLIHEWEKQFPIHQGWGIALLCGRASKTIGLDIDSNDQKLMALIPPSPCVKRGETGETRFFTYTEDFPRTVVIKPQVAVRGKEQVEVLSNGKYTLLPPSIHERTKEQYIWTGEEPLIEIAAGTLPTLNPLVLDEIANYYARKYGYEHDSEKPQVSLAGIHHSDGIRTAHGAHDRLKKLTAILIAKETPLEEGIKELLKYDEEHHVGVSYFSDKSRGADSKADPETNAARFYVQQLSFINNKRRREGLDVHRILPTPIAILNDPAHFERPATKYPEPRGLMRLFTQYCDSVSNGAQDALGLGGSLALMSVLASNRFATRVGSYDVWPNLYVLNIAHSGFGKEVSQRTIDRLLAHTELIGSSNYKSDSSIVMGLPEQQERLDVIDECSALIKAMGARESYKSDIVEVLCKLYSVSESRFMGAASVDKGKNFGACWNPCVNILGSTTPAGFKNSVTQEMAAKGLMPRFIMFWQKEIGECKTLFDRERSKELLANCDTLVRAILSWPKQIHPDSLQTNLVEDGLEKTNRYQPTQMAMSTAAQNLWSEIDLFYYNLKRAEPDSFESAFKGRFAQHTAKIALLDALSLAQTDIMIDNVEWAHSVVKAQWDNSRDLYEEVMAQNDHQRNLIRVQHLFKKQPIVTRRELSRWTHLKKNEIDGILNQLQDAEYIERVPAPARGSKTQAFQLVVEKSII